MIGIEFIAVPTSEILRFDGRGTWNFDLPVHLRYQQPTQNSRVSGSVIIPAPSVYVRKHRTVETERSCDDSVDNVCTIDEVHNKALAKKQRRYKRYYDVTFLGNKGNSDEIEKELLVMNPYFDNGTRYEKLLPLSQNTSRGNDYFSSCSNQAVMWMPLGNSSDLIPVLITTFGVTVVTTFGLIILMIRKAMNRRD